MIEILVVTQISQDKTPTITYVSNNNELTLQEESKKLDGNIEEFEECEKKVKSIKFTGFSGRKKFALIMHIIAFVHEKLIAYSKTSENENFYCTRRSFYYELKNKMAGKIVDKQLSVDQAVNDVSLILECGPWEIGKQLNNNIYQTT